MKPVVLLTDFGLEDHYVGVLHAVLHRWAPGAARIDLGHAVSVGDVWEACFQLRCAWPHLPTEAVVLAVVDPGVGGVRRAMAVRAGERWLVAPDNGLAAASGEVDEARVLDWRTMGLDEPSTTFHGRDLFAPAAGRLARGDSATDLGQETPVESLVPCPLPEPTTTGIGLEGVILHVDRFGNLITNIEAARVPEHAGLHFGGIGNAERVRTYCDAPEAAVVALQGSSGLLELAVNGGSAAAVTGLGRGDTVTVGNEEFGIRNWE